MITVFAVNAVQGNGEMKMTKFEEKLEKVPIKTIQHPVGDTKYYAAVHVKTLITQADEEIANLKSQLQQQELPVVPEDVDKAIKYLKEYNTTSFSDFNDILTTKGFLWLNDFQFKDRRFGVGGLNNKLFILSHLAVTGYTVEKPQLFYIELPNVYGLKNKVSVSKVENGTILGFSNGKDYALALTEQEIKSIDECYWQFAVPVEDNK